MFAPITDRILCARAIHSLNIPIVEKMETGSKPDADGLPVQLYPWLELMEDLKNFLFHKGN